MSDRFDAAVWAGIERRLAAVESVIPDAPPWQATADVLRTPGPVGPGRTLRGRTEDLRPRRRLALTLAVILMLCAMVVGALLVGGLPDQRSRDERFGTYGILRQTDGSAWAALLPDGRTLIVSGAWHGMGNALARAHSWDPVAGFVSIDPPTLPRVNPTTTLLPDGRVLVVGGFGGPFQYSSSAIASAEVWDPKSATYVETGAMAAARVGHTATVLPDGRVLIVGGDGPAGDAAEAELWDPRTNEFSPAGRLMNPRGGHAATLLLDGRVMVAGGVDPVAGTGVGNVELWDPSSQAFTVVTTLLDSPRSLTLTRLPAGPVLMAGAYLTPGGYRGVITWAPSSRGPSLEMVHAREGHTATLLADGRVMVAGGWSPTGELLDSVELWDPSSGRFHATTPLMRPAANHTAVLQADGRVLIVLDGSGPDGVLEPFLYQPEPSR